MNKQTLAREADLSGRGVHSGRPVNLRLKPSTAGKLVFRRTDLDGLEIKLDPMAAGARHCTFVRTGDAVVQTIEHLLAALRMSDIDSALVELDAEEVPILDGSAAPFLKAVSAAGVSSLPAKRRTLKVLKPFRFQDNDTDAYVSFEPGPDFRISYGIEFAHPLIARQELSLSLTRESFASAVAPARTFGFLKDVDKLRSLGLALGASFENTVVLDDEKVLNPPLRFPDEFVRHKILDFVGDLAVAGAPILGHVRAEKAGHALHLRALQSFLQTPDHWVWVDG